MSILLSEIYYSTKQNVIKRIISSDQ